jgi:hypothetical protein
MMARSTTCSNQRPDTLMQDRSPPARRNRLQRTVGPYIGSNSEVPARNWEVRFALRNGHCLPGLSGPKSANRQHLRLAQCYRDRQLCFKGPAHLKACSVHACGTLTDRGTKVSVETLEGEAAARRQETTAHVADSQRSSGPAVQNERARR